MFEKKKQKIDRFYVSKKDFADFNRLKETDSPFSGSQNKDVFLAAMVVGFHEKCKIELERKKEGYFHERNLDKREKALINAIAVAEEGELKALIDKQKVYSIAEQYATGGLALLKAKIFHGDYGSYAKKLENELLRSYKKARISEPTVVKTIEELDSMAIEELIQNDESETLEFKSTMIWDVKKRLPRKELKVVIAKTVASFMNVNGGVLLIGVDDNNNVTGIAEDLAQFRKSKDEYIQSFTGLINTYLGKVCGPCVKMSFKTIGHKEVAVVRVSRTPRPVFLRPPGKKEEFCIRSGNISITLEVSEANLYIKDHWPDLR